LLPGHFLYRHGCLILHQFSFDNYKNLFIYLF
jgi:hypothetical protein